MPRVLVVTYPWLPAFNGTVKHVATLVRHLPEAGWDPIVLARDFTEGGSEEDAALHLAWPPVDDCAPLRAVRGVAVVRVPFAARENRATRWRASLDAPGEDARPSGGRRIARAALEETYPLYGDYPDAFRGWVEPAVAAGVAAVRQYGIGAVVSVSAPDSAHIAGGEIARAAGIPWIPLFGELGAFRVGEGDGRTLRQRVLHRALTRRWLRGASRAAAVTPALAAYLADAHAIAVEALAIPFDPEERRMPPRRVTGAPLRAVHVGRIDPGGAGIATLLAAVEQLVAHQAAAADTLRIELVGSECEPALRALLADHAAAAMVHLVPRVSPAESVVVQREADLLVTIDRPAGDDVAAIARPRASLPEHLNARRPILAISPEGSHLRQVLADTRAGTAADTVGEVVDALGAALDELRETGELRFRGDEMAIARHAGPEQARRLVGLLDVASAERIGSWQRS